MIDFVAMKRTRIWGWPKYPRPHAKRLAINREENENDDGRRNPQHPTRVLEAVRKEVGKREGIVFNFGVYAKPCRNELPIEERPDDESDRKPTFAHAEKVHSAREPHQKPAAHVARTDGKCRHEAA